MDSDRYLVPLQVGCQVTTKGQILIDCPIGGKARKRKEKGRGGAVGEGDGGAVGTGERGDVLITRNRGGGSRRRARWCGRSRSLKKKKWNREGRGRGRWEETPKKKRQDGGGGRKNDVKEQRNENQSRRGVERTFPVEHTGQGADASESGSDYKWCVSSNPNPPCE